MAQFLLLLGGIDPALASADTADYAPVMEAYVLWTRRLRESGRLVESHKLKDGVGRRLTWQDGRVVDGPYAETKESIGGYYLIEAATLADAVELARSCPTVALQGGVVEVRLVEI